MADKGTATGWESRFLDRPDGARLRLARWGPTPDTPRAAVLILHGRTEFNEKYQETAEDLQRLGFAVWTFDWRGQGLSSRLLADRQRGHVETYDVMADDLAAVIAAVKAEIGDLKLVLLAHSMGGHVAVRYLQTGAAEVAAAILSAPMLGIGNERFPNWLARAMSRTAVALGYAGGYALSQRPWRPGRERFEGNPLTSDRNRHAIQQRWFADNPDLVLGGVTWGWLDQSIRSGAELAVPERAARVAVPTLFAQAGRDVVVSQSAIERVAALTPGAVLKLYPEARHEILMERDEIRDALLADLDAFLKNLGI